jgi:hypothetical protein
MWGDRSSWKRASPERMSKMGVAYSGTWIAERIRRSEIMFRESDCSAHKGTLP